MSDPSSALTFASRRATVVWALLGGLAGAGLAVLALLPAAGLGVPVCMLRAATGIPCPGCGLTRGLTALVHGDLAAAWAFHPFALLLSAQGLLAWLAAGWPLLRGRALRVPSWVIERALVWNGAGLLALWLGRAATGTLP
jgi:hypothetical protein